MTKRGKIALFILSKETGLHIHKITFKFGYNHLIRCLNCYFYKPFVFRAKQWASQAIDEIDEYARENREIFYDAADLIEFSKNICYGKFAGKKF